MDEMVHAKRKTQYIEDLHIFIKMKSYECDLLEDWETVQPEK